MLIAALLPVAAAAHPLSVSYSRFELKDQALVATIRLPTDDADLLLQLDEDLDGRVSEKEIAAASPRIAGYVLKNLMVTQSSRATSFTLKGAGSWKDDQGQSYVEVTLRGEGVSPDQALDLKVTVLMDLYSSHRNLAEAVTPAGRQTMVFEDGRVWRLEPKRASGWKTGWAFLKLGVEHIGADAGANAVANFIALHGAGARLYRHLQGFYLRLAMGYTGKRLAHLGLCIAPCALQLYRGFVLQGQCLTHLGLCATTGKQRHGQLQADLLLGVNAAALTAGASYVNSNLFVVNEQKYFASTDGSYIDQDVHRIWPTFTVTAIDKASGKFRSRDALSAPMGLGYEYLTPQAADKIPGAAGTGLIGYRNSYDMLEDAALAAKQVKEKLTAKSVTAGKYDLVLEPNHLGLTIHESVGHPLELDRVLGYEANYAGTSFATLEWKAKGIPYGSKLVNIVADKLQPGSLGAVGYDDEGVKAKRWRWVTRSPSP